MIGHGDLHRKFNDLVSKLLDMDIRDENILNVGDFGIGFDHDDLEKMRLLNNVLSTRNIHLYVQRGNHDDPRFFMGRYMNMFSHIHFVPDYTVLEIEGNKVLFIGGAISVDRLRLKKLMQGEDAAGKLPLHFDNEGITLTDDNIQMLSELRGLDIVVTHSAPSYCFPFGVGLIPEDDITLAKELIEERKILDKVFEIIMQNNSIKYHIYGHFHKYNQQEHCNVVHYCLAENELKSLYL